MPGVVSRAVTPYDWYAPHEVQRWQPQHIYWLFEHYDGISNGFWPDKRSGYVDNPYVTPPFRSASGAYFETPMGIIAELHQRLELCGYDGELILCLRGLRWEEGRICRLLHINQWELGRVERRVVGYIRGRKRKARSYQEYCRH